MAILEEAENIEGLYLVECPGCKMLHQIPTKHSHPGANWNFNGDMEKPTFSPSLLVRSAWGDEREKRVCHSFIRDGMWQFLNDCTHDLAGQTVPMIDIE